MQLSMVFVLSKWSKTMLRWLDLFKDHCLSFFVNLFWFFYLGQVSNLQNSQVMPSESLLKPSAWVAFHLVRILLHVLDVIDFSTFYLPHMEYGEVLVS
jgi:hypothetical protein